MRPTTVAKMSANGPKSYPGRAQVEAVVRPVIEPVAKKWAANTVARCLGFWVIWHSYGNLSAIVDAGFMSRATAYKARADFVQVFGVNVEDFSPVAAAAVAAEMRQAPRVSEAVQPVE